MCLLVDKSYENDVELGGKQPVLPNNKELAHWRPGLPRTDKQYLQTVAVGGQYRHRLNPYLTY